ncbi:fungal-specific transcription factor domain-containing protein [Xylariomycetidae sp. FL0641]|nr:fungal-specific transcription factor domain-containing protein [Xylariomycetidae sp. FL0641]
MASTQGPSSGAAPALTSTTSTSTGTKPARLRSCVTCRARRVRCDKLSPCTNCRRAKIDCVVPSKDDQPPRWARRLERLARSHGDAYDPATAPMMDRLRNLESLVKELTSQLEQANSAANESNVSTRDSPAVTSPGSSNQEFRSEYGHPLPPRPSVAGLSNQLGKMVIQASNRTRYVSSVFWSRINEEIEGLKADAKELAGNAGESSEEEENTPSPAPGEMERSPSDRNAFLFGHNLNDGSPPVELRNLHPLPSQIPFLLGVFAENFNIILQVIHLPTVAKMVRDLRGDLRALTPLNEALLFSIYYAAISSMEEDDVMNNFGTPKAELSMKYRVGLEKALAKADFLEVPDLVLLQAFTIFLVPVRNHGSARFVWMMLGLAVRMAHALGLHRDGSHFPNMTPYEVEMRRRVWWCLCVLDIRAAEDLGTDLTISRSSFDTKIALNINDADIEPGSMVAPTTIEGATDMSVAIAAYEITQETHRVMGPGPSGQPLEPHETDHLLQQFKTRTESVYLRLGTANHGMIHWVMFVIVNLVISKMTLLTYLPSLLSSPAYVATPPPQQDPSSSSPPPDPQRTRLLAAAIEVAEYNHALHATQSCRNWRWIYQTYTHWHSVVFMLLEVVRRAWSPVCERAWAALHSPWLMPRGQHPGAGTNAGDPELRRLFAHVRRHRANEIARLRSDPVAAAAVERADREAQQPADIRVFRDPGGGGGGPRGPRVDEVFRARWRVLVGLDPNPHQGPEALPSSQQQQQQQQQKGKQKHQQQQQQQQQQQSSRPTDSYGPPYPSTAAAAYPSTATPAQPPPIAPTGASHPMTPSTPLNAGPRSAPTGMAWHHPSPSTASSPPPPAAPFAMPPPPQSHTTWTDTGGNPWMWGDDGGGGSSGGYGMPVDVGANYDMQLDGGWNGEGGVVSGSGGGTVDWLDWMQSAKELESMGGGAGAAGGAGGWM